MSHRVEHLEEKITIAKLIQEAISNIKLPEGYSIKSNQSTIEYLPQKQLIVQVYLNRTPKGDYDTSLDLQ